MTSSIKKACKCCLQAIFITIAIGSFFLLLSGCASLFSETKANNQQKAGSTFLSVVSIASWDEYKNAMRPQFSLSPDAALADVLPNTMSYNQQTLQAFGAQLKVALPGSSVAGTSTVSSTNGKVSTSSQQTTTTSPGDVTKISPVPSPAGNTSLPAAPGGFTSSATDDPMLKYWAATALYQEVQLLDKYIDNAAVGDPGKFKPYVVRMQISYMPRARNEPYDVYTTLSFFNGDYPPIEQFEPSRPLPPLPTDCDSDEAPRIVPLLVTDDIEAMLHANGLENIRQLELALAGMVQGVGFSGDVQNSLNRLQSVIGNDFNSTFAVARVSDNSLRVRLGARYSPTSKYTQVAQTHYVTVVVLVPTQKQRPDSPIADMHITAQTKLVDANNGNPLKDIGNEEIVRKAQKKVEQWDTKHELKTLEEVLPLWYYTEQNNYAEFNNYINAHAPRLHFRQALWIDLASLQDISKFAFARVHVPVKTAVYFKQQGLLFDNTNSTTLSVFGSDIVSNGLWATWTYTDPHARPIVIPSQKISVSQPHQVDVTFPSLKTLGVEPGTANLVTLYRDASTAATFTCDYYMVSNKPSAAQFTFSTEAKSVISDRNGLGSVYIGVTSPTTGGSPAVSDVLVTVTGADVTAITDMHGAVQNLQDTSWKLPVNAVFKMSLANLVPYTTVSIQAKSSGAQPGGAGETSKTDLPVIALPFKQ